LLALSVCLGLSGHALAAGAATLKGKIYPDEHKVLKAEESGFEVLQLTTHAADDSGLYFTNRSFVPDENGLVFTSKRTGAWNLFYMNLKTFTFVQLTDSKQISGTGAEVCAATREVFYRDGQSIKAVHLKTLVERTLTTIPPGYSLGSAVSVTASGKALAFSISENIKLTTKTNVIYSDMDERFAKRPWSAVWTGRADGSGWHEIARQKKWISHTLISPQNPDLILYCHEGRWNQVEQRLWLVNADGSNNRRLRPEEKPEIAIGHEFWFDDGIHVGYQVRYPKGKPMIGVADTRDGSYREYPVPFSDSHMQASHHGDLFIGDGTDKQPFLSLYRLEAGMLTGRHIFRHGSSFSQQHWHPHPAFSPDDAYVLFTSCRAGNGDVYLIKLP
jgi:oligogalacturonide lyase